MLRRWMPLWTIPVLIIFAMGTVWLRLAIVRTTYAIHETNHQLDQVRKDREVLQVKMAALRSPQRLEVLARTKYGLSPPRVDQVIHFKTTENY